jgi:hypothetical protein
MPEPAHRLALLIAAPWRGEAAMHGDVQMVYEGLAARGMSADELLVIEGGLDRRLLLDVLGAVRIRAAGWAEGELFVYYSGHGAYAPLDAVEADAAEPALVLAPGDLDEPRRWLFWRDVFSALELPPSVRLALLPDC